MAIRIVDLDNCIADDGWRISLINWKREDLTERYHKYHTMSLYDEFRNKDIIQNEDDIVVFTARPELYRMRTARWLARNGIKPLMVFMRPNNNHDHSVELKRSMLKQLIKELALSEEDTLEMKAFDDREDVLEMYQNEFGLKIEHRQIHNVCAYTPPTRKEDETDRHI